MPVLSKQQLVSSRFFLVFVACLAAAGPLSIDMYMPLFPDMAESFNQNIATVNLTISSFMIGMAAGQLLGGPLSDQLGRKPVGLIGLVVFLLASLGIVLATDINTVLLLRLCQGLGGGFASVICMAQARDVFEPGIVARKFANIIMVILLAPMIAPTLGSMMVDFGWRAPFWALIVYSLVVLVLYLVFFPETNENKSGSFNFRAIFSSYKETIQNRTSGKFLSLRVVLFGAFSSGILFCYVVNATLIFVRHYELSAFEFSTAFGAMAGMLMVGNRISAFLMAQHAPLRILQWSNHLQLLFGVGLVLLCLLSEPSLWIVYVGIAVLIACGGAISPAAGGFYIGLFSRNIGAASSLYSSLTFAFGAIAGALAALLSNGELWPIFAVMLACALIGRLLLDSAMRISNSAQ